MRREEGSIMDYAAEFYSFPWQERLAALERRWVGNTPENAAAWQSQKAECMQCIYAACMQFSGDYTFDERSQAAISVLSALERYCPEKYHLQEGGKLDSPLAAYILGHVRRKLISAYTGAKETVTTVSLDKEIGDEEHAAPLKTLIPGDPGEYSTGILVSDAASAAMLSLMAQITDFDTFQHNQRRNETRRKYYRLSFTEQAACFAQNGGFHRIRGRRFFNAADTARAMDRDYLGFFCEDLPAGGSLPEQLERAVLRRRCECLPGEDGDRRLEWKSNGFLEAKVPLCFLLRHDSLISSNGEISRYRKEYLADARRMLENIGFDSTVLREAADDTPLASRT